MFENYRDSSPPRTGFIGVCSLIYIMISTVFLETEKLLKDCTDCYTGVDLGLSALHDQALIAQEKCLFQLKMLF